MAKYLVFGVDIKTGKSAWYRITAGSPEGAEAIINGRGVAVDPGRTRLEHAEQQSSSSPKAVNVVKGRRRHPAEMLGSSMRWTFANSSRKLGSGTVVFFIILAIALILAARYDGKVNADYLARNPGARANPRPLASQPPPLPPPAPRLFVQDPIVGEVRMAPALFVRQIVTDNAKIDEGVYVRWRIRIENLTGHAQSVTVRPALFNADESIVGVGEPEVFRAHEGARWIEGDDLFDNWRWDRTKSLRFEVVSVERSAW